ncbi:MAG: MBL fold metallo-hydrolase [Clostridia bacterium]
MTAVFACTLFSSSKGNVTYIKNKNEEFLIDAGMSARAIENSLNSLGTSLKNIKGIFITHEHSDHVKGLEIIAKYYKIPIYAPFLSAICIRNMSPYLSDNVDVFDDGEVKEFAETRVNAYRTPHDSDGSVCYRFELGNTTLGYATDIGHISKNVTEALSKCDSVVIESNHDVDLLKNGAYPFSLKKRILGDYGHLSNTSCAAFVPYLVQNGTKSIVLAHLSLENNRPEIAFSETNGALAAKGIAVCRENIIGDVCLAVAPPTSICNITID